MNKDFWDALPMMIALLGGCTWFTVASWAAERRREREAYYRSEAIKKIAEMQGNAPESVLQLLREALTPSSGPSAGWSWSTKVAKEFYQSEAIREIARTSGGGAAALEFLRERERNAARNIREGLRIGGFVSAAVGIGLMPFLRMMVPNQPAYLVGLIPLLVGVVLLTYSYVLTPQS